MSTFSTKRRIRWSPVWWEVYLLESTVGWWREACKEGFEMVICPVAGREGWCEGSARSPNEKKKVRRLHLIRRLCYRRRPLGAASGRAGPSRAGPGRTRPRPGREGRRIRSRTRDERKRVKNGPLQAPPHLPPSRLLRGVFCSWIRRASRSRPSRAEQWLLIEKSNQVVFIATECPFLKEP